VVAVERGWGPGFVRLRTGGEREGPPRWRKDERGGGAGEGGRSGSGSGEGKRIGNHKLDCWCRTRPAVVGRGIARAKMFLRRTAASSAQPNDQVSCRC
jgi:hypothetical protein